MIKKIVLAVMLAAGLSSSAFAQATFTAKDAAGSTQTFKSFNCSANICSLSVPADITGAAFGVTANPFFVVNSGTFATQAAQSGTWNITNISGTISLPTGASTSALQGTNTATTAHTCSVAGYSELGCLGQIDDDVKGPIPAGTNLIGKVGIDQTTPGTTNGVQLPASNPAIPLWGHGPVTPGTAATGSVLAGATYNSTAPTFTTGQQGPVQVSSRGGLLLGNGYPAGSTPITISGTGTTGATTATLATGASVTTYICGFSIRANATAAATGNATVTGTITGTLNFTQWTAPNASGLGISEEIFTPCIPASAANTGIAVISAAPGTGGVVSVTAWGYTL